MSYIPNVMNWNECEWTDMREKVRVLTFHSENMTVTLTEVKPGHAVNPHKHPYEQIVVILQGEGDFYVDGKPCRVTPGCLLTVPENIEHYLIVTGDETALNLDIFYPARPDRAESKPALDKAARAMIELFTGKA